MKINKFCLLFFGLILGFVSCKKEDDGGFDVVEIEVRDRDEQQKADMDSLAIYLGSHYYNSEELANIGLDAGIQDIVITKLGDGEVVPDGHTLLMDAVGDSKKTVYAETDYEYFVLEINVGGGNTSPTFADTVQILYEGFLRDGSVFDFKFIPDNNPLDLTDVISGWRKVIPNFNTAESYIINNDGTVNYYNSGLGVMFLPSGLSYFYNSRTGIPAYSPLIFKFEVLQADLNDHDNDSVPSYLEDINSNGELLSADFSTGDDDTDGDGLPNYLDDDDDGDGVPTIDEDINGDGDPTNDIGKNGIANYLDPEETASK